MIDSIGMATMCLECLTSAVSSGRFGAIQTFHRNTLLNRTAHDALYPLAKAKGVAILDSAPFAGYILATGPIQGARYNYYPASVEIIEAVKRIEKACQRKGVSLQEAAIAFALHNEYVSTLTIATSQPERIREWTKALDCTLGREDLYELMEAAGPSFPLAGSLLEERLRANG